MTASSLSSWLRLPRPKSFFGFMSLQTGTELISIALLFNKATGIYGILTLFTGYSLSALQITAYLGSIFVLLTLAVCIPHIRQRSPLQNLALAWVYAIDTLVSAGYTAAFATTWYLASMHDTKGPAGAEDDVSSPSNGDVQLDPSQEAQVKAGTTVHDTAASMVLIVALTLIRIYLTLVITAYARMVLLRFVDEQMSDSKEVADVSPDPFAVGAPLGEGWRGRLGRAMVSIGKGYWLGGKKEDEEWTRQVNSKFRSTRD
ncbi:Inositolphosphorylceramide synthase subunit Kei1-domain-containing protein [Dichotomopilus funicola]|uniref:Inositolphosphorylceramide synthase subunit Kei1-domain-containing protein n=1 Tax=Dichotomopilus funicola TaxID=1934379 RepID=A0AAN6UXV9_9PEZI|nr:Inositolphosphorylceramide synthase subunit Kei1-domain-containing protein [Dichotomopilus funicola]